MRHLLSSLFVLLLASSCMQTRIEDQVRSMGNRAFTPETWATANAVERAQMLGSFFAQYPAARLTTGHVRKLLGEPTGYYDYDENLAYYIGPATVESRYGKERMLVFLTDKHTGNINEIELVPPLP
ncbi:hypothetical protein [Massilia sp. MS-15]|uniref:hypothetical protein n=1 Tax=Massilia sp. MS-15 TaxID=2878200 RepID=UPI001CD42D0B|nr:hypothetical protein [Massilia sp. MS-15]MCA1245079.1 hypothetical protein [Massilia sp. MS-15]